MITVFIHLTELSTILFFFQTKQLFAHNVPGICGLVSRFYIIWYRLKLFDKTSGACHSCVSYSGFGSCTWIVRLPMHGQVNSSFIE